MDIFMTYTRKPEGGRSMCTVWSYLIWAGCGHAVIHESVYLLSRPKPSPKYLAELQGPPQPENAYGESERLGLTKAMNAHLKYS